MISLALCLCANVQANARNDGEIDDILNDPYLNKPKARKPVGGKIVDNEGVGKDDSMEQMLNMAMGMVKNMAGEPDKGQEKNSGRRDSSATGADGGGSQANDFDMASMMKMASGMMQQMNGGGTGDKKGKDAFDMGSMLSMASSLMGQKDEGGNGNGNADMLNLAGNLLSSMSDSGGDDKGSSGGAGGLLSSLGGLLGGNKAATAGTGMLLASHLMPKMASFLGGASGTGVEEMVKFLFNSMEDHVDPILYTKVKKNLSKMPNDLAVILSQFNLKTTYDGYMLLQTKNVQKAVLEVEILYLISILLEYVLIPGLMLAILMYLYRLFRGRTYDSRFDKKYDARDEERNYYGMKHRHTLHE